MGVAASIQQERPLIGVDDQLSWHGSVTYAIGIDAGAATITAGVVDIATGAVVRRLAVPSVRGDNAALDACVGLATELASTHPVDLIGIAVPEIVRRGGSIESADNWDWRHLDVPGAFRSIGVAALQSDVRAAAFGEARVGAGHGLECFLYVIVDTGISAVVVRHGVPWDGRCGAALILGVPPVEDVAGGKAFSALAAGDAREVLDSPRQAELVSRAATRLGEEVARAVNLTDPDAVIVGGALGLHPGYRRQWVEVMRRSIWYRPTSLVPVVASELEADAVLVGAALAAAAVVPV
jgi:glucokinase